MGGLTTNVLGAPSECLKCLSLVLLNILVFDLVGNSPWCWFSLCFFFLFACSL